MIPKKTKIKFTGIIVLISLSFFPTYSQTVADYITSGKQKSEARVFTAAIEDFSKALKLNNKSEDAYYLRGLAYYKIGRYPEALQDFNVSIQLAPSIALNYYWRGKSQLMLEDNSMALWDLGKAISIDGNNPDFHVERAIANLKDARYGQAQEDCKSAFKLKSLYPPALSVLGLVYLNQGKHEEAYDYLNRAVNLSPNEATHHLNLAYYYFKRDEKDKSIEHYTTSINLDPYNPEAYFRRAMLKITLGSDLEAQRDANRVILHNRRFQKAYVIRGIASYNLKETDRHEYDFQHYLSQARTADDYYFIASQTYASAKEEQYHEEERLNPKAEIWANRALELEETYEHQLLYAQILFKLRKTTSASDAARKAQNLARREGKNNIAVNELIASLDREKIDKTAPVLRVFAPVASSRGVIVVESTDKITVIGQATDESGVVSVLINGNPARLQADGNFDGETVLLEGNNYITVRAVDSRGNESKTTFQIDKVPQKPLTADKNEKKNPTGGVRRALMFATNEYESWSPLANPIPDAQTLGKDLKEIYGYEVDVQTNLNKNQVLLKIKEYAQLKYGPNDQLMIFFAGHGQFDEVFKEGYVVAKDSDFNDESKSSYIAHSNLRTYINNISCKHVLLVMDVCFGGTIDPMIAMRGAERTFDSDREELIRQKMSLNSRIYLTSGGKEYVPDGRPGQHSPFCRRLLEAFRSGGGIDGVLTMGEIMQFVGLITPNPLLGQLGQNDPGADFLFISK